ncbi:MAG: hypothetical protein GX552_12120 [Chloroflexi bacterium]|nr:hypothetical protein [Chloroflexota bacterium]
MVRVTFRLSTSVSAKVVHLAGDFNNWNPWSHRLTRSSDGEWWEITLLLKRGRAYEYRYLLDHARWCNDWHADQYVPNIFGGDNSVLQV